MVNKDTATPAAEASESLMGAGQVISASTPTTATTTTPTTTATTPITPIAPIAPTMAKKQASAAPAMPAPPIASTVSAASAASPASAGNAMSAVPAGSVASSASLGAAASAAPAMPASPIASSMPAGSAASPASAAPVPSAAPAMSVQPPSPRLRPIAAAALTALAALSFHRLLPWGPLVAAAGVGIACALAVGLLLTGPRRTPLALSLVATAVLWLPVAPVAIGLTAGRAAGGPAIGPAPTISSLMNLVRGIGGGWWRVLTTVPPLGPDPAVLAAVSALCALAAFGAVEVALRTKAVLPLAAFGLVVLVVGLFAGGPGSDVLPVVGFAVATAMLTAALTGEGAAFSIKALRRYAAKAPAVAVIGVVALLCGAIGSGRAPFDPRSLVSPPAAAHPAVDPLQQVAEWVGTPNTRLFTLRADTAALTAAPNLRLTVLDRFDGAAWSSDAVYTATGSRIPDADSAGGADGAKSAGADKAASTTPTASVHEEVSVDHLSTLWLPAASRPTTISASGSRLAVDPDGELLIPDGTHPGLRYAVTAQVPQYPADALRGATPVADPTTTELPGDVPPIIAQTAQTATDGAGFPYQQAERLADYLRTSAVYDPTAPAGDSYGHIAYFLGTSHRGGSDQFAVAFALMARSLGLPTRIAVGFAVPPTAVAAAHDAAAAGATGSVSSSVSSSDSGRGTVGVDVIGADALVWPEIDFAGLGWVPFYPTPSGSVRSGALHPASGESAARQTIDSQLAAAKLPDPKQLPVPKNGTSDAAPQSLAHDAAPMSPWPVVGASVVAALLLYFGYVFGIPGVRRARRRRSPDPALSVLGAWWETVALLRTLGLGPVALRTSAQIAAFGAGRLDADGSRAVAALARRADFAAFSPNAKPRGDADHDLTGKQIADQMVSPAANPTGVQMVSPAVNLNGAQMVGPAANPPGPTAGYVVGPTASQMVSPTADPTAIQMLDPTAGQFASQMPSPTSTTPMAAFLQQAAPRRPACDAAFAAEAWADYARVRAAVRDAVPVAARIRHRLLPVPRREG